MVWVPITKSTMVFRGPMPTGNEVMIGTLGALEQDLEHINEICWLAKEETILSWTETEGYPAKTLKDVETGAEDGKKATYSTESLAKFAFSIFWRAMKFAKEHRTTTKPTVEQDRKPMLNSYSGSAFFIHSGSPG